MNDIWGWLYESHKIRLNIEKRWSKEKHTHTMLTSKIIFIVRLQSRNLFNARSNLYGISVVLFFVIHDQVFSMILDQFIVGSVAFCFLFQFDVCRRTERSNLFQQILTHTISFFSLNISSIQLFLSFVLEEKHFNEYSYFIIIIKLKKHLRQHSHTRLPTTLECFGKSVFGTCPVTYSRLNKSNQLIYFRTIDAFHWINYSMLTQRMFTVD